MSKERTSEGSVAGGHDNSQASTAGPKRVVHPIVVRMAQSSGHIMSSPQSLVSAGYASLTMALFNVFRPTPVILYVLAGRYKKISPVLHFNKTILYCVLFTWKGLVLFVLFFLGIILVASRKITNRGILMLHPWGLLILYFDIFVWLSVTSWFHWEVFKVPELTDNIFDHLEYPLAYFIVIYVECFFIGLLYYVYATYFIIAELTVIERFF